MPGSVAFIALPQGSLPDGRLKLACLVVPRLEAAATLAEAGLADWPALLRGTIFALLVAGARQPLPQRAAADAALWARLFPPDLPVRAAPGQPLGSRFASYSADGLASLSDAVQQDVLRGAERRLDAVRAALAANARDAAIVRRPDVARQMDAAGSGGRRDDAGLLADFTMFHAPEPVAQTAASDTTDPDATPVAPLPDLHQRMTLLADHPEILRALGLILDFALPADLLSEGETAIAVAATLPAVSGLSAMAPETLADRRGAHFRAASRSGNACALPLGDRSTDGPTHRLVGYDLDAAGHALTGHLRSGSRDMAPRRSTGISLLEAGRARRLADAVAAGQQALAEGAPLTAEDLTRGLRLDVFEERTGQWASLHARVITYATEGAPPPVADESTLVPALAQRSRSAAAVAAGEHDPLATLFLGEQLALWNGWSLAVPRPGALPEAAAGPAGFLPHSLSVPAGALPRLRFGHRYRLRARRVDPAGESVAPGSDDPLLAAPAVPLPPLGGDPWPFLRHDPLRPPDPAPGGPADRLVVRDGDAADDSRMTLLPPSVSPQFAEWCGSFDQAFGPGGDPGALAALAARLAVPDPHAWGIAVLDCPGLLPGEVGQMDGATLRRRPGPVSDAPPVLLVPFSGTWPDRGGVALALAEGLNAPFLADDGSTILLHLAEGAERVVQLATVPEAAALPLFADLADAPDLAALAAIGSLAAVSPARPLALVAAVSLPLLEPTLPRLAVDRVTNAPQAFFGATISFDAPTTGALRIDGAWTDAPDLAAEGETFPETRAMLVDVPLGADGVLPTGVAVDGPGTLRIVHPDFSRRHAAVEIAVAATTEAVRKANRAAAQAGLGNAGLDRENSALIAASRVRPVDRAWPAVAEAARSLSHLATLLQADAPDAPDDLPTTPPGLYLDVINNADMTAAAADRAQSWRSLAGPTFAFSDSRARILTVRAVATSRFVALFPERIGCDRIGLPQRLVVPASAKPPPPRVRDCLPIFFWTRTFDAGGTGTSERRSGLRLVLERPWLASGPDEMLALLFGTAGTRWGRDPLIDSRTLPRAPVAANAGGPGVLRPEGRDFAAWPVRLDSMGRALVDLLIDSGSTYSPFLQPMVARFQPQALPGLELSDSVLLDPVPMPPNRRLTVTRGESIGLALDGPATAGVRDRDDPAGRRPNQVIARFERQIPGALGAVGWVADPSAGEVVERDLGTSLWRAQCTPGPPSERPARIAIFEHEQWPDDRNAAAESPRLIFFETIDL